MPVSEAQSVALRVVRRHRSRDPRRSVAQHRHVQLPRLARRPLQPVRGHEVLELGSGHGDLTERLARGRIVHASDVSESCLSVLEERFADRRTWSSSGSTSPSTFLTSSTTPSSWSTCWSTSPTTPAPCAGSDKRSCPAAASCSTSRAARALQPVDRDIGHYRRYRKREPWRSSRARATGSVRRADINSVGASDGSRTAGCCAGRPRTRSRSVPATVSSCRY